MPATTDRTNCLEAVGVGEAGSSGDLAALAYIQADIWVLLKSFIVMSELILPN